MQFYLRVGFVFYYKNYTATYLEKIPKNKAVVFLSNHQNALLDPLLITMKSTRLNFFLTRAGVFKNPLVAKILDSVQMLPVYRMMDGRDTIIKNKKVFSFCAEKLRQKKSIVLFPEGNHSLKRRGRPLKKGFSRIIEETLQKYPATEIIIIPVGVNYQNPTKYGDSMSVYFGKHISPNDYLEDNLINLSEITDAVRAEIKTLTTHIENLSEYDKTIARLQELNVDFTNPIEVNKCINNNFNYSGKKIKKDSKLYLFFEFLVKAFYFLPYYVWKKIACPKIKEDEFIATFRYAVIIALAPIFLITEVVLANYLINGTAAIVILTTGIVLPLFTLRIK